MIKDLENFIIGVIIGLGLTILSIGNCWADSFDINLTSIHSDKSFNYNEYNYGGGYSKDVNENVQIKAGVFRNSYKKPSAYLMAKVISDIGLGVDIGFISGYDKINQVKKDAENLSKYQPIVLPTYTFKVYKKHFLEIGYMPKFKKDTYSFVTLQYQYKFNFGEI